MLYDSPAPTLAPLYDLVSTTAYPDLTQRLAMSVDGARMIGDVDAAAWLRSAVDANVSRRFLEQRMAPFVERVADAAPSLAADAEYAGSAAEHISAEILERARRFS